MIISGNTDKKNIDNFDAQCYNKTKNVSVYNRGDTIKPTIKDVAQAAGVSVATVSRYLNKSSLIAPASAEKVRDAIEQLHYRPNMMARGLAKKNTDTVALVVDYSNKEIYEDDFFLKMQVGLERTLADLGYYLMLVNASAGKKAKELIEKIILEERIDGLVLLNEMADSSMIQLLHKAHMPFVVIGQDEYINADWVDIDNVMGGYIATKKLIDIGAEKIGFVTDGLDKRFANQRFMGYQQALKEFELMPAGSPFVVRKNEIYQDLLLYLNNNANVCDAYVATDSFIAYYFIQALKNSGFIVPEKVRIVAFDNQLLSQVSDPEITVVDIDMVLLGEQAARLLVNNIKNPEQAEIRRHELVGVKLIERKSTK